MQEKIVKEISKLKEGQKVKIIYKEDAFTVEGIVKRTEPDEECEDYEWVVYLDLENKGYGFFAHQSEIKEIIILDDTEK